MRDIGVSIVLYRRFQTIIQGVMFSHSSAVRGVLEFWCKRQVSRYSGNAYLLMGMRSHVRRRRLFFREGTNIVQIRYVLLRRAGASRANGLGSGFLIVQRCVASSRFCSLGGAAFLVRRYRRAITMIGRF